MIGAIHGRLVRDPELRQGTKDGRQWSICNFSVAVDNRFGNGTSFYDCHISGKMAEALNKFFCKGKEIVVYGEMKQEPYEKDGKTIRPWRFAADSFDFCGSKNDGSGGSAPAASSTAPAPDGFDDVNEDIPF